MVDRWYLPIEPNFGTERPRPEEVEEYLAALIERYAFQENFWNVFWSRVIASSYAAYAWGIEFGCGNRIAETAQVGALFADISYPILAANDPNAWNRLIRYCRITGAPLRRYELSCLDVRHHLASGILCREWNFHDDIVRSIETHHAFPTRKQNWTASDCIFFGQAIATVINPNMITREAQEWTLQTIADVAGVQVTDILPVLSDVNRNLRIAKKRLRISELGSVTQIPTEGWTAGRCMIEAWEPNSAATPKTNLRQTFQELRHLLPSGLPDSEQLLYQLSEHDDWSMVNGRFLDSGIDPGDTFRLAMGVPTILEHQTNAAREVWAVRLPTSSARQAVYLAIYDHETAQRKPYVKSIHRSLGAGAYLEAKLVEARYVEHFCKTLRNQTAELYDKSLRISELARRIAKSMNLGAIEIEIVTNAALLKEIGDIGIQQNMEANSLLDEAKPLRSARMLRQTLPEEAEIVAAQAEKWDGSGFPVGMKGKQIPIGARIISVAEAMVLGSLDKRSFDPEMFSVAVDLAANAA